MKTPKITASFTITCEDLDLLDERARALDLTRSQLLRRLVETLKQKEQVK